MKLQLLTLAVLAAVACLDAQHLSAAEPAPVYGQGTVPAPVYCCPPNGNGGYGQAGYGNGGYGYGYNNGGYYNSNRYQGGGASGGLPQGRRYYNGRYFGNFNNRYYGPQYGYF